MHEIEITSESEQQTKSIGEKFSRCLSKGDIICLIGELGSGKTTFVKGLAKGLGINPKKVNSPTFILMNNYQAKIPLYHFDLYRIENVNEIGMIGYEEYLYGNGISVIEWAEKLERLMPGECIVIGFKHHNEHTRFLSIKFFGKRYQQYSKKIKMKK